MAGALFRSIFNTTLTLHNSTNLRSFHTATVSYAARKGTRAKARAKKVKVEVTKVGFIPHNQRAHKNKTEKAHVNKHLDDSFKRISKDNVFPMRYYRWPVYTPEEAFKAHQETHHVTMYNMPDALVFAQVELNMEAIKKNKYLDTFSRLALLPHGFTRDDERTILAFCKTPEMIKAAMECGATLAGGTDLIKKVQEGTIKMSDYDFVIAHPNILTELVPIRGLMKRKFPNLRNGTLDNDVAAMVVKFAKGVQCTAIKDDFQQDYGCMEVPIGRLNMQAKEVSENLQALLKDVQAVRPKRPGLFITRCFMVSPPSSEKLKVDPFAFVERTLSTDDQDDSDDEEEKVAAKA